MPVAHDKVALLRAVPLFADLDERSVQAVAVLAQERTVPAGEVLMREGEPGEEFIVIVEGTVHVQKRGHDVRSLLAGGFLGEVALVEHEPRTATATCATECTLLVLRHHEFDRLMTSFPEVRRKVLAAMGRRAHLTD
jgi:CRP-like cAMP-binding protein